LDLSIIIPCFNEAANIAAIVERFFLCKPKNLSVELVLVDNGSTDSSQKEISKFLGKDDNIQCFSIPKNEGYGNGIWEGLKSAKGEYLCWTHADLQTDIKECFEAYFSILSQNDKINTYVKGMRTDGRTVTERMFSLAMEIVEFLILGKYMTEINAQPNLFHKSFINEMNPPKQWEFELFFYYIAKLKGIKIVRIPVKWKDRILGSSKWNYNLFSKMRYILKILIYSFKLRLKYLLKKS